MRADISQPLKTQTKVGLFFNLEETLSYGQYTRPTFKNSQCQMQLITLSPPRFAPLILLVDGQHMDHAPCSQQRLLIHFSRFSTITHRSNFMIHAAE